MSTLDSITKTPPVSVVMAVHDDSQAIRKTVESVLAQSGVEFELVLIDDGSKESTRKMLEEYQKESRIKVLSQAHSGLTSALIKGVDYSRFDYIARIDAGDEMMVERLAQQARVLASNEDAVLVCSHVEMVTRENFVLYTIKSNEENITQYLNDPECSEAEIPFHASVMFRKSAYQQAGGYRAQFYFSQDFDLWSRLIEVGRFMVIPRVLTKAEYTVAGISAEYKQQQLAMTELIKSAKRARLEGRTETALLDQAALILPESQKKSSTPDFAGNYFIARSLARQNSPGAGIYFRRAIRSKPYSAKAWTGLGLWWWRGLIKND